MQFESVALPGRAGVMLATVEHCENGQSKLLITLKNTGHVPLAVGGSTDYAELSINIFRQNHGAWVPVNRLNEHRNASKLKNPFLDGYRYQFVPPSKEISWDFPLSQYFEIGKGHYQAVVNIKFNIEPAGASYSMCASTAPLDFRLH